MHSSSSAVYMCDIPDDPSISVCGLLTCCSKEVLSLQYFSFCTELAVAVLPVPRNQQEAVVSMQF